MGDMTGNKTTIFADFSLLIVSASAFWQ